jgi:hypothetical protein
MKRIDLKPNSPHNGAPIIRFFPCVVFNPELSGDALNLSASSGGTSAMLFLSGLSRTTRISLVQGDSIVRCKEWFDSISNTERGQHRGDKQLGRHPRNGMVGLFGSLAELSALSRDGKLPSCTNARIVEFKVLRRTRTCSMIPLFIKCPRLGYLLRSHRNSNSGHSSVDATGRRCAA